MSSLPVASRSRLGQGWLVLIADPSILINSMVEMEDNQLFLENVLREHNSATQVLVDQSHLPKVELDKAKKFLAISRNVFATLGGTLGLTALVLTLTLKPIWRKNKPIDKEEDIE